MAKFVIDVSYAQGNISWEQVKKAGVDGVLIQCGYGDNIVSQDDKYWKRNADECARLGIPFGAYIYSYATSMAQTESEAQHVLRCVKGYELSYPIYLDLEESGTEAGAAERAKRFGDIIEAAGYWCGVYANLNWWNNYLPGLDRFTKWIAQYNSKCDYTGANKDIWQYSSTGSVAGINGNVDMNECYRNFPLEMSGGTLASNAIQQVAGKPVNDFGLNYRAHCQTGGTLPVVHDGQTAGTVGYGKRLEALWIDLRKIRKLYPTAKLKAKVHIQSIGWKLYDNVEHDTVLGTTGKAKRIEALELEMTGLPEGKKLYYRTHLAKTGWTPWVQGRFSTGSVGISKAIEAIQIKIV